jgi:hypothetical protein
MLYLGVVILAAITKIDKVLGSAQYNNNVLFSNKKYQKAKEKKSICKE